MLKGITGRRLEANEEVRDHHRQVTKVDNTLAVEIPCFLHRNRIGSGYKQIAYEIGQIAEIDKAIKVGISILKDSNCPAHLLVKNLRVVF